MAFWYSSDYSKELEKKGQTLSEPLYDLQYQIQAAFLDDPDTRDCGIEVLNSRGIVTRRGTVPTHAARDSTEEIVRAMAGVTNVINEIDIV